MTVPVIVRKATDKDGCVLWRLPEGVQAAIDMLPKDQQAKYMKVIGLMAAMMYHCACEEIHYAARTSTPLFFDLNLTLGSFKKMQELRRKLATSRPKTVN